MVFKKVSERETAKLHVMTSKYIFFYKFTKILKNALDHE